MRTFTGIVVLSIIDKTLLILVHSSVSANAKTYISSQGNPIRKWKVLEYEERNDVEIKT